MTRATLGGSGDPTRCSGAGVGVSVCHGHPYISSPTHAVTAGTRIGRSIVPREPMSIPPELRAIIDEDLLAIRTELRSLAPGAEIVLAGSIAFEEPWAWRNECGNWVIESDYDLYLLAPSLRAATGLARSTRLRDMGRRLGTRAPVDPYVIWRPLMDRGLVGMVGRSLRSDAFVDCVLDPRTLMVNQARKAVLRHRLLAPREPPERARYQRVKAAVEALRTLILAAHPDTTPRALFSMRANLRWLRSWPQALPPEDAALLTELIEARLQIDASRPSETLMRWVETWLEHFASQGALAAVARGPSPRPRPSTTTARAWASWLRQGLLPDPRVDYDRALIEVLGDPLTPRVAGEPAATAAFDRRWRHLCLANGRPGRSGALVRAVDGALGNPMSAKGERYLMPQRFEP